MSALGWGILFVFIVVVLCVLVWALPLIFLGLLYVGEAVGNLGSGFELVDLVFFGIGVFLFRRYSGPVGGFGFLLIVVGVVAPIVGLWFGRDRPSNPYMR
jgi:hypothetical protein